MRFIPRGPDIPNNLLFAHEEGRVVFFCGAGISMGKSAGLPSFKDLVKRLFEDCGHEKEWKPRKHAPLDQSLTWLEDTVSGRRKEIIEHVYEILNPVDLPPENSPIHEALLALARPRNSDATMLVTTNFDRLFERCQTNKQPEIVAPRLPIPKPNHWYEGGVVYLHGLIPEYPKNDVHKDNLILTSGDFGRAYLSERWAARFVTELFRNYVVCFVGYSLNDPVMRYLSDALAADDKDGIRLPKRYIFLPERKGSNTDEKDYPGLEPIPYLKTRNHHLLRETLKKWAKDYNDKNTRNRIIQEFIDSGTSTLSHATKIRSIPGIDRFMWALCNKNAAEYFAMMHPRPPLEIINVLDAKEFGFDDLISFGHSNIPSKEPDNFQKFSLLEPKIKFEDMTYWNISDPGFYSKSSPVHYFYKWIARHVDKPETASWVAQKGGSLNVEFKKIILRELAKEHPDPPIASIMHEVWGLVLSDNMYDMMAWRDKLGAWLKQYELTGLTSSLKRQLEQIIQPKVKLSPNICITDDTVEEYFPKADEIKDARYIGQIFEVKIDLVPDYGFVKLKEIALSEETPDDDKLFYIHFFHSLLCKIFTLADETCGNGRYFTAFLSSNLDNMLYGKQEYLIREWYHILDAMPKLLSDITKKDQEKAKAIVMEWLDSHYILINRIALHCLREPSLIDGESILRDHATQFSKDSCHRIQAALLSIRDDNSYDYLIIAYLKAIQDVGINLLEDAKALLEKLNAKRRYSGSALSPKPAPPPSVEADEPTWVKYLVDPPKGPDDPSRDNLFKTWDNLCEARPLKAFEVLKLWNVEKDQSDQYWPWYSFFRQIAPIIRQQVGALSNKVSDDSGKGKSEQLDIVAIIDYWLDDIKERDQAKLLLEVLRIAESGLRLLISSGKGDKQIEKVMNCAMKLLTQYPEDCHGYVSEGSDILTAAINSPIGKFVELVMQHQILTSPQDSDGLLSITKQFFEKILSIKQSDISRYGLYMIAIRSAYLFSYDKEWTTEKLIPCFSWDDKTKARITWSGYLRHAHWTPDLIKRLDDDLFATIDHIDDLDKDCKDTFAYLIGSLALYETDILSVVDLHKCVDKFNEDLRCALLKKIKSSLISAEKNDRGTFWKNRIEPFFKKIWPNDVDKLDAGMSYAFGDIILAAEDAFPDAFNLLAHKLAVAIKKSTNYPDGHFYFVLQSLKDSNYAERFPEATLDLLVKTLVRETVVGKERKDIWEQHILKHLKPLNDKRLESIKEKIKWQ